MFDIFVTCVYFPLKSGIPEVREVSRKLPGARGFAVIEYGPVASHGDPIQAGFCKRKNAHFQDIVQNLKLRPDFSFFGGYLEWARPI